MIPQDYIDRLYAGWLGKLIGVRLGAPIEGWSYEQIAKTYGTVTDYLVDYRDFAADDDSNGPMFFLRALEDYGLDATAEEMGLTWLNYAPYEHGFYWWGGYGKSTEHTAYLNLRNGIPAPRSGSIEQNGAAVAEQIGGQIFIDTWGLVNPGNPGRAAAYAKKAASVSHDGNGIYGGMFVAACISAAFVEQNIHSVIRAGLGVIPADCEYARMAGDVLAFYKENPGDWRHCFHFVKEHYGYDKYPGNCHIIPNSAVMLLSMLYGEGDFSDTLNICNMCGWDTDCNVGNVGTIMGVLCGLRGIDYKKWREPVNDFFVCSSVLGSLNVMDAPWCVFYMAKLGYGIAGEPYPLKWEAHLSGNAPKYHFDLPGSTQGFCLRAEGGEKAELSLKNCGGAVKAVVNHLPGPGSSFDLYVKTHYHPADFHDSRYDPCFSPILYPGQSVAAVVRGEEGAPLRACLYVKNREELLCGPMVDLMPGEDANLVYTIPSLEGGCIEEAGVRLMPTAFGSASASLFSMDFAGGPDYTVDFAKETIEHWNGLHREVSQFTCTKGIWELEDGALSGSCADFAEAFTGDRGWGNYSFSAALCPQIGESHGICFRVQGAIRYYALVLSENNTLRLIKEQNGKKLLGECPFDWENGGSYRLTVKLQGNRIVVLFGDKVLLTVQDTDNPYLSGAVGAAVYDGSHCHFKDFAICAGQLVEGE